MTNTAINPSVKTYNAIAIDANGYEYLGTAKKVIRSSDDLKPSLLFQITPHIAVKLEPLDAGLRLKGFSVQRADYELYPYGTINRPFYTYDQALDALACCKASHPEREYHLQQFGHDSFSDVYPWQKQIDEAEPFARAWLLQQIADCLNAYTLSNTCTSQDYLDASQACSAAAKAIEPLLASFSPDQHGFSDSMKHYAEQGNALYQAAMSIDAEMTA